MPKESRRLISRGRHQIRQRTFHRIFKLFCDLTERKKATLALADPALAKPRRAGDKLSGRSNLN